MALGNGGAAPFQVNLQFKRNFIGKLVVNNAAAEEPLAPAPADMVAGAAVGDDAANALNGGNGGNGGDTIQLNLANQEQMQDVTQTNDLVGVIGQDSGDAFSLAIDFGGGDAIAVSDTSQRARIRQDAANVNVQEQQIDQENRN
ncbi:hypothetical protein [Salirhabdus sp. Marseille-P4669]|uniref:hypothetical protein n=1 Tax=Salirhabdus sp. Marseille-P4669 TaxID=2042310 RepID=UPI000C7C880B|nr:hypothetical protein [Salirhabdus sp. Marseille-P4669]